MTTTTANVHAVDSAGADNICHASDQDQGSFPNN